MSDQMIADYGCWMPDAAIRETVADWIAASMAYSGEMPRAGSWKWGNENLVDKLWLVATDMQPEISARGGFLFFLAAHDLITTEQQQACMGIGKRSEHEKAP